MNENCEIALKLFVEILSTTIAEKQIYIYDTEYHPLLEILRI